MLFDFGKKATQEGGIRTRHGQLYFCTLIQEFANHRHTSSCMPQSPVQRCNKDFQRAASSQAFAQSP